MAASHDTIKKHKTLNLTDVPVYRPQGGEQGTLHAGGSLHTPTEPVGAVPVAEMERLQ